MTEEATAEQLDGVDVAIVGMSGQFPGARSVEELWTALRAGVSGISTFTDEELRAAGVPEDLLRDPAYVKAGAVLDDIAGFDAEFFGLPPAEARILDPQQRLFLEHSWGALEDAGCDPTRFDGQIGVFGGSAWSTYLSNNLRPRTDLLDTMGELTVGLGNEKDSLATRVAHTFGLSGPCFAIQSYCSTSLVAVATAATCLATGECDLALAGGVSVAVPHRVGYLHQAGGMTSPDGRCRAFDAQAAGTPVGSGVAVVALRRLADAVAAGDRIYAVVRGWAVNNDGGRTVGFTAPGVRGQADVVAEALASAGLTAADIDYIEAHGTGTALGDAAELGALQQVFSRQQCLIGSVKSNVGHLDRAAGVTGLIKVALALHHEHLPATLNFTAPNEQLRAGDAELTVVGQARPWPCGPVPRRAGVSAFGIGGTNAHVVLEEAPQLAPVAAQADLAAVTRPVPDLGPVGAHRTAPPAPRPEVLVWSGRSGKAADDYPALLADRLSRDADRLAGTAHTLQTGRRVFEHRRALVVVDSADAVEALRSGERVLGRTETRGDRATGWLIASAGAQYPGMLAEPYATEPAFRAIVDDLRAVLRDQIGGDPVGVFVEPQVASAATATTGGSPAGPQVELAVFAVEYALGRQLLDWGVRPAVMAGQGFGEYVAAALAGVLTPTDAIRLLVRQATVPGPPALDTGAGSALTGWVRDSVVLSPPRIPYVSTVTGRMITGEQAMDPAYWGEHLRAPADFARVIATAFADGDRALLQIGPGPVPSALVREHAAADAGRLPLVIPTVPEAAGRSAGTTLAEAVAWLWLAGVPIDWDAYQAGRGLRKTGVPGYPFQRQRFWIDPPAPQRHAPEAVDPLAGGQPVAAFATYDGATEPARDGVGVRPTNPPAVLVPTWRPGPADPSVPAGAGRWVLLADASGVAARLAALLTAAGAEVVTVHTGPSFVATDDGYAIRPGEAADYAELIRRLAADRSDQRLTFVSLWPLDTFQTEPGDAVRNGLTAAVEPGSGHEALTVGRLASAVGTADLGAVRILAVTRGAHLVTPGDPVAPQQAAVAPVCVVAGQEYPGLACRTIDLDPVDPGVDADAGLLLEESRCTEPAALTAYRGTVRFLPGYLPLAAGDDTGEGTGAAAPIRRGGTYLITGGLGDVGRLVARHLTEAGAGRLVLTSRRGLAGSDGRSDAGPRAEAVHALRELGAEVLTPAVDVTDTVAMRELFGELTAGDGRVDGVIHAAGETDLSTIRPLSETSPDLLDRHFAAKVLGARVLGAVLGGLPADRRPEFCLLFSSTSATLGGLGFAPYAAANAVLSALACAEDRSVTRWTAAAWDTWEPTLERLPDGSTPHGGLGAAMAEHSMSARDALAVFDRVLTTNHPSVLVAVGDLAARQAAWSSPSRPAAPATGAAARPDLAQPYVRPRTGTERVLAQLWSELLGIAEIGVNDNFFDLGGNSLLGLQLVPLVKKRFRVPVSAVTLFAAPTVRAYADLLDTGSEPVERAADPGSESVERAPDPGSKLAGPAPDGTAGRQSAPWSSRLDHAVAIVGMAGRFPGAEDVAKFWDNLLAGEETISYFSTDDLIACGVPAEQLADPSYVPARPVLDDIRGFDAELFGYSPRAATFTDPQQRIFLEVCWEALEHAGYGAAAHRGRVGVFGGTNISTYLLQAHERLRLDEQMNDYELVMGNDKDALTTTVSYTFDLSGPSVAVQTFCSTSLVAVHLASQSLRAGECELAMAGGVSVRVPDRVGHLYQPGGMASPDGHVRTFDADARGSMFGDGAAVVVLKPLAAALRDRDTIWAVIRGSAINNDGALKVGYTAPSVVGQAAVVADALADAGVAATEVGYIEAHGTGTELGDPIEVAALTRAFGSADRQYCAIGSVKPNVGHLDRAAGVAGLIKTALAVRHGVIPPTLNFRTPNPEIDFANSPFRVNTELCRWPAARKRVAGVNSLGMGGTNVHVVVEQPPPRAATASARRCHVVPVSAASEVAADQACARLGEAVAADPSVELADVAYTLQVGRKLFAHRRVAVGRDSAELARSFAGDRGAPALLRRVDPTEGRPVGFAFAGVGEQYPGMVAELYHREPRFRDALDECAAVLAEPLPHIDLLDLLTRRRTDDATATGLFGRAASADERAAILRRTEAAQPAVFAVEYSVGRTLTEWGLRPEAMLGYSLGEYVAACHAGVLSLPDALRLVAYRAGLIAKQPPGAMLAVSLSADELPRRFGALAPQGLDVAVRNGPHTVVVAGPPDAVEALAGRLAEAEVAHMPLDTTHAFHSRMLAPLRAELTDWIRANVTLHAPAVPYFSNLTGRPVDAALVTDPEYWARHMCETVEFSDGAQGLLDAHDLAIIEIGPGQSLGALLRSLDCPRDRWPLIVGTLPNANSRLADDETLADCLGRLWLAGVEIDWTAYHDEPATDGARRPGRVPLPTYPFQRKEFWISDERPAGGARPGREPAPDPDAARPGGSLFDAVDALPRLPEDRWLHLPAWRQKPAPQPAPTDGRWLAFTRPGIAETVVEALRLTGADVVTVRPGAAFAGPATDDLGDPDGGYRIRPGSPEDALALMTALAATDRLPRRVVHLWTLTDDPGAHPGLGAVDDESIRHGMHTLVALARGAGEIGLAGWALDIVTSATQKVLPTDVVHPARATVTGPLRVIPLEYPGVATRLIDVQPTIGQRTVRTLTAELTTPPVDQLVALRAGQRWVSGYETVPPPDLRPAGEVPDGLRHRGVYLITGGLGGIGLAMAEHLARCCRARLVLLGRTGLPPARAWDGLLAGAEPDDAEAVRIRRRVAAVRQLLDLGAEVDVVTGDVSVAADVAAAVDLAVRRHGALHGVLHAAGVPAIGLMQVKDPADLDTVLVPKVAGTAALARALRMGEPDEVPLDFCVLFSSITAMTGGGPGQVDYCAANAFLDAFATSAATPGRRVIALDWGEWTWNAWEHGLTGYDPALRDFFRANRARVGIGFAEGWRALLRALALDECRLVVSTQDFAEVARLSMDFTVDSVRMPAGRDGAGSRYPRPDLASAYLAPQTSAQQAIARIWAEALKLDRVGVADSFFELGGNSLIGVDIVARLRREFGLTALAPHVLYEAPTVEALAVLVAGPDDPGGPDPAPRLDRRLRAELRRSGLRDGAIQRRRGDR